MLLPILPHPPSSSPSHADFPRDHMMLARLLGGESGISARIQFELTRLVLALGNSFMFAIVKLPLRLATKGEGMETSTTILRHLPIPRVLSIFSLPSLLLWLPVDPKERSEYSE